MTDDAKERVLREVKEAIECASRGEAHPRLYNYKAHGLKERERRAIARATPPAPAAERTDKPSGPLVLDWTDRIAGPGGAARND